MSKCRDGCGNCKNKYGKESGWTPRYYIMYIVGGHAGMGGEWETVRKVELLENAADEKKAKIEAGKWLRKMRKKGWLRKNPKKLISYIKLESAKLVASVHKDILKLV